MRASFRRKIKTVHASLPNGKEVVAIYTSRGRTEEIDIDASSADDNLYLALRHRFGFPEQIDEIGKSPWSTYWGGGSNIRLKIDSLERSRVSAGACGSSTSTKPNKDFWRAGGQFSVIRR